MENRISLKLLNYLHGLFKKKANFIYNSSHVYIPFLSDIAP